MPSDTFNAQTIALDEISQLSTLIEETALLAAPRTLPEIEDFEGIRDYLHELSNSQYLSSDLTERLAKDGLILAPALQLRLDLAENTFNFWLSTLSLENEIKDIVTQLQTFYIIATLQGDELFALDQTPSKILQEINQAALGWHSNAGKGAEKFIPQLQALPSKLVNAALNDIDSARNLCDDFMLFVNKEQQRALAIQQRSCEAEAGTIKAQVRQKYIVNYLNKNLCNQLLPPETDLFLRSTWYEELKYQYISQGDKSIIWQCWEKIIPAFRKVFSPNKNDEQKQKLYSLLPKLITVLEKPLEPQTCSKEAYEEFISNILFSFTALLKNEAVECVAFKAIPGSDLAHGIRTSISETLQQQQEKLKEGQWFVFRGEERLRCKLALKVENTDQLLFVNFSGRKVLQKSLEEFSLCLSTKIAIPLSKKHALDKALIKGIETLHQFYLSETERCENTKKSYLLSQQEKIVAQELLEQEAEDQRQSDINSRKMAAEKARQEAEQLVNERRLKAEAAEQAREDEIERLKKQGDDVLLEKKQNAEEQLNSMQIGSWLDIPNKQGETTRCKLAVTMKSTGKYIFVDKLGTKVAEYYHDKLIDMLLAKQMHIIDGDRFEERLSRVIGGLRKGD